MSDETPQEIEARKREARLRTYAAGADDQTEADIKALLDHVRALSQQVSDLQSDLADAQAERDETAAKSKEKTKAAGEKVAALMAERDEWKQRAEYKPSEAALKASLETEIALNNKLTTDLAGYKDEKVAMDKQYLEVCKERDALKAMHKRLGDGVQQVFGFVGRPVTGDVAMKRCSLPGPDKPIGYDLKPGESWLMTLLGDGCQYIVYTKPIAVEMPVPEREVVEPEQLQDAA